jgi:hypothetical protein
MRFRYLFEGRRFRRRQDDLTLSGGLNITCTLVEHPEYAMVVPRRTTVGL